MHITNPLRLTVELPKENWESVLRALQTVRTTTRNDSEQQQLDMAYQLIENTLNETSTQQLVDSPMEVQSSIPITVKVVTGDWA